MNRKLLRGFVEGVALSLGAGMTIWGLSQLFMRLQG